MHENTTTTRDPRAALAWLESGRPLRIDCVNLADWLRHVRALVAAQRRAAA